MSKVYISVPEALLTQIDKTAAETGMSRSGFIQEASARYLHDLEAAQAEERRRERMRRALDRIRKTASLNAGFDEVAEVRRNRNRDGAPDAP
jgi:metal-responsive CopG/Arc/MetJ family transcriptional regulator